MRTFALTLFFSAFGCASTPLPGTVKPYRPLTVQTQASRAAVFAAAQEIGRALDWSHMVVSGNRVTAVTAAESGVRDRVIINITPGGALEVDVRTEMERDGRWAYSNVVCSSYDHSREKQLAESILQQAQHPAGGYAEAR